MKTDTPESIIFLYITITFMLAKSSFACPHALHGHCLYIPYINTQESLSKFLQNRYWDILGSTSFSSHSNYIFTFLADMSNMDFSTAVYATWTPAKDKSKKINWTVLQWELNVYLSENIGSFQQPCSSTYLLHHQFARSKNAYVMAYTITKGCRSTI